MYVSSQRTLALHRVRTAALHDRQGEWGCRDEPTVGQECAVRDGHPAGRHPLERGAEIEQGVVLTCCYGPVHFHVL